jgi:hypothetical protein
VEGGVPIGAARLARDVGRAPRSENVVANLECEPVCAAELRVRIGAFGIAAGGKRAELTRRGEQRARLARDHLEILRHRDARIRFETDVEALTLAHAQIGLVQHVEHLDDAVRHERFFVEQREIADRAERVAGVDPVRESVARPRGGAAVAQLVAVLDIVVYQRVVVKDLDRDGRIDRALNRTALLECGPQEYLGPEALARLRLLERVVAEVVADHVVDRRGSAMPLQGACEMRLDKVN